MDPAEGLRDGRSEPDGPLYERLRGLAHRAFGKGREDDTLTPTALVHEAWLRLAHRDPDDYASPSHFVAAAAQAMRHALVDHARKGQADKRGGDRRRCDLATGMLSYDDEALPTLLDLDAALRKLANEHPRRAQVVELKFFAGLTLDEVAGTLGVGDTTVSEDWRKARGWLAKELTP